MGFVLYGFGRGEKIMLNKYRYMLINKVNKTVKMVDSESCMATTQGKICNDLNIDYMSFLETHKLEWNGQDEDFKRLSKKYSKFKRI